MNRAVLIAVMLAAAAMTGAAAPAPVQAPTPASVPVPSGPAVLMLRGLDKITGRPTNIEAPIGKPVAMKPWRGGPSPPSLLV